MKHQLLSFGMKYFIALSFFLSLSLDALPCPSLKGEENRIKELTSKSFKTPGDRLELRYLLPQNEVKKLVYANFSASSLKDHEVAQKSMHAFLLKERISDRDLIALQERINSCR